MTTIANAIKNFEAKLEEGQTADTMAKVELYCQVPPISKLDAGLNALAACEQLSLSTNCIDRMANLGGLTKLKILSMGRNNLKKIEHLESNAATLEELWVSYNQISTLDGLGGLNSLRSLYISNNSIKQWSELEKLKDLPELKDVLLIGNPIYAEFTPELARIEVVKYLPNITKLDGDMVTGAEKEAAAGIVEE